MYTSTMKIAAPSSKPHSSVYPRHWYTCRKLNCWFYSAVISRGTGLNFGNDPFATVGEGGGLRTKRRRKRSRKKGLKGRMKGSSRRQGRKRERVQSSRRSVRHQRRGQEERKGGGRRRPINRRALSQSRKTAKLHLPF